MKRNQINIKPSVSGDKLSNCETRKRKYNRISIEPSNSAENANSSSEKSGKYYSISIETSRGANNSDRPEQPWTEKERKHDKKQTIAINMGLCLWVPNRKSFKCDSIPIYHERFAWIPVLPVQSIELQIFVYEHAHESVTPKWFSLVKLRTKLPLEYHHKYAGRLIYWDNHLVAVYFRQHSGEVQFVPKSNKFEIKKKEVAK
ncbi:hypothetical protein CDAR_381461 [Caerostris darwini]|uniref:Uncharacterized protein n=1 Tax=Caerostris darwini TaxID=1538125 RepID=A0AAV4UMB2_9ARAC|nr:hypothetical protein CDAR_381461 [Caerostris darwini]